MEDEIIVETWTLQYVDPARNHHKFYQVHLAMLPSGGRVAYQWGRIGSKGQSKLETYPVYASAAAHAIDKLDEKIAKGYVRTQHTVSAPTREQIDLLGLQGVRPASQADPFARLEQAASAAISHLTGPDRLDMDLVFAVREQAERLQRSFENSQGWADAVEQLLKTKASLTPVS